MEIVPLGKVVVAAKIQNLADLLELRNGALTAEQVRSVDVTDALVDTGATMLSLPLRSIRQLGLQRFRGGSDGTAVAGQPGARRGAHDRNVLGRTVRRTA